MRIDYSEPKKSFTGVVPGKHRPRKEPARSITGIVAVSVIIAFTAGFGTGWFYSQRSAKRSFKAAMEQKSLENSPTPPPATQAAKPAQAQPPASPAGSLPAPPGAQPAATAAAPTPPGAPEPNLSFYKTLPSGQKSNVIGSGINASDDKGKKVLQAAIPSNLRQQTAEPETAPVSERPTAPEKTGARSQENSGFTVQVASYALKSEAENMKKKLAAKGLNVFIFESNQGDKGLWYRVRVGRKLEQEAAKELAGRLGKGAIVIPDRE